MSSSNDKFCLKWNDFQQNITNTYTELRSNSDFSDVTLVCKDNQHIEAHRVILSASSPFFMEVFQKNKHSHPMIYMRGMKAKGLHAIMDFIYHGEANVCQEDLKEFLELAEELQLKGLDDRGNEEELVDSRTPEHVEDETKVKQKTTKKIKTTLFKEELSFNGPLKPYHENVSLDLFNSTAVSVENSDLDAQLNSMMEKLEGKWTCTACDKFSGKKSHTKQHIESKHTEGITHFCNLCGKHSRSTSALAVHKSKYHK